MAFIKFNDCETLVQASVIPVSDTVVRIETETEPNLSGFILYLDEHMSYPMSNDEYKGYTTLYRQYTGAYELSNDGSVWEEPASYIPTVTFRSINGTTEQKVSNYKDVVAPNIILKDGFEFKGWEPELPKEGEIKEDITFYAVIVDKNVYFHTSEGGSLEGDLRQLVDNYNQLEIPSVIADENYKFVGWVPEIPTEGKIDLTNTMFCAVFENNIADRVGTLESDLTDTQLGLVENYDFATNIEEEVTNLQLALVEVYELLLGGM